MRCKDESIVLDGKILRRAMFSGGPAQPSPTIAMAIVAASPHWRSSATL
jgi:hypothetical protein